MTQDVYAKITDRILTALKEGVVPWHKPWDAENGRPRNLISGKPYRGVNLWLLSHQEGCPFWLTYRQASQIGGHVKKGAKGSTGIFWKIMAKKDATDEAQSDEKKSPGGYAMARAYTVFNASQCELPEQWQARADIRPMAMNDSQKILSCERIVDRMPARPEIMHGGVRAFYRASSDEVTMPEPSRFEAPEMYYSTLFHELTHSTGHHSRLNRPTLVDMVAFGDTSYSKEELVAEMGAAFLCGVAGIENRTCLDSASYIQAWLSKLQDDPKLLIQAAAQAQKAADCILGEDIEAEE